MNTLENRIKACAKAVSDGETSLCDALREHFPEATSGDEDPGMARALRASVEHYVRAWVRAWATYKVPTLTDGHVAALQHLHAAMEDASEAGALKALVRFTPINLTAVATVHEAVVSALARVDPDGDSRTATGDTDPDEIGQLLARHGFEEISTGGGCEAYHRPLGAGLSMEVSDASALPETWDALLSISIGPSGEPALGLHMTARQLVDALGKEPQPVEGDDSAAAVPAGDATLEALCSALDKRVVGGFQIIREFAGCVEIAAPWMGQIAIVAKPTGDDVDYVEYSVLTAGDDSLAGPTVHVPAWGIVGDPKATTANVAQWEETFRIARPILMNGIAALLNGQREEAAKILDVGALDAAGE